MIAGSPGESPQGRARGGQVRGWIDPPDRKRAKSSTGSPVAWELRGCRIAGDGRRGHLGHTGRPRREGQGPRRRPGNRGVDDDPNGSAAGRDRRLPRIVMARLRLQNPSLDSEVGNGVVWHRLRNPTYFPRRAPCPADSHYRRRPLGQVGEQPGGGSKSLSATRPRRPVRRTAPQAPGQVVRERRDESLLSKTATLRCPPRSR